MRCFCVGGTDHQLVLAVEGSSRQRGLRPLLVRAWHLHGESGRHNRSFVAARTTTTTSGRSQGGRKCMTEHLGHRAKTCRKFVPMDVLTTSMRGANVGGRTTGKNYMFRGGMANPVGCWPSLCPPSPRTFAHLAFSQGQRRRTFDTRKTRNVNSRMGL